MIPWFLHAQDTKLIYRHFATLFFVVLCDKSESELGILDLIQGALSIVLRRQPRALRMRAVALLATVAWPSSRYPTAPRDGQSNRRDLRSRVT